MRTSLQVLSFCSLSFIVACQGRIDLDDRRYDASVDATTNDAEAPVRIDCGANGLCRGEREQQEVEGSGSGYGEPTDDIRPALIHDRQAGLSIGAETPSDLIEGTCAGDVFTQVETGDTGDELHVISIESAGDSKVVRVFVDREQDVTLVLSAYQTTHWAVEVAPDARITEIVLNGEGNQYLDTAAQAVVTRLIGTQSLGSFGTGGDSDKQRRATAALIGAAEEVTGLPLKSFAGCMRASAFSISGE